VDCKFNGIVPRPYFDWVVDTPNQQTIKDAQDNLKKQQAYMDDLIANSSGSIGMDIPPAIKELNNPANFMDIGGEKVPIVNVTPDPGAVLVQWQSNPHNDTKVVQIDSSVSTDLSSNVFFRGDEATYDLFGYSVSGKVFAIDANKGDFTAVLSAVGVQNFTFRRGQWWNALLVAKYKQGPWRDGAPTFWGPQGNFNALPTGAIVVYKPKLVVSLGNVDYTAIKDAQNPSLFFGAIKFAPNSLQFNDATRTITVQISDATPQLVGLVVQAINYP